MNGKYLEGINITHTCSNEENKHKENSSTYDDKGEEKTSGTSEKKGKCVMVMLVFINAAKTYANHSMNTYAQQRLYTSVICKSLWQSTNMNMKSCEIVL